MIGLQHGTQREAEVLAGLLALLMDPDKYREKIEDLSRATKQHRDAIDTHAKAKASAEITLAQAQEQLRVVAEEEEALKKQKIELDATANKLVAETRKLSDNMVAHAQAITAHETKVKTHEQRELELKAQVMQHATRMDQLNAREDAVRKAEAAHLDRVRRLREIIE